MEQAGPPEPVRMHGRQLEWALVLDLLRGARRGQGGALLVESEPGMGRTLLLTEAASRADAEGFSLVIGAGHELSRLMPLAPLLSVLGESPRILRANARGGMLDGGMWLIEELRTRLERRTHKGPVMIRLDDLQWADPVTLLALRTLPSRLASFPLAWMLARRTADRASDAETLFDLLEGEGAARLRLRPLNDDAVASLIADALGAVPEPRLVKLAAGAAGNPSMLIELIGGLRDENAVTISGGRADLSSAHMPLRTRAVVHRRIKGLSPRARQFVETAAILGGSFGLDDVATMLGESPAALLAPVEEALAAGILVATQDTIDFGQELVRHAITESLPPPIRQAVHRQAGKMLLERGGSALQGAAAHLLAGARRGDAAALAGLDQAAAEVLPSSPQIAVVLAMRALELTRLSDPKRAVRAVSAAEALVASGQLDEAFQVLEEEHAATLPALTRAQLGCVQSCWFSLSGQPSRGLEEAEKVLAQPRLPNTLRDKARIALLRALLGLRESKRAASTATTILVRPRDGRRRAIVAAMVARALTMWDAGQVTEALQLSREAARADGWLQPDIRGFQPHLFLAARLVDVHGFDEAARIMLTAADQLDAFPYSGVQAILATLRARMHLANGRPDAAAGEIQGGSGVVSGSGEVVLSGTASAILGSIALRRGELAAAASYMERDHPLSSHPEAAYERSWHVLVSAQVQEARTGAHTAVDMLKPIYAVLRERRFLLAYDPTSASSLVRLALAIGDRRRAELAATTADEIAHANPSFPVLTAAAAHARGIADADVQLLSLAAERHGDWWARASAAEDAGVLLAARIERRLAVARLDQALNGYHGCGATRDAARVRRRLRGLGVRRRHWTSARRPVTGWASLTETERKTSQLAAQGLTNQQIAKQMYLSVHTVAFHLRQVFRKLDISSRVELTRLVIEEDRKSRDKHPEKPAAQRPTWPDGTSRGRSTHRP